MGAEVGVAAAHLHRANGALPADRAEAMLAKCCAGEGAGAPAGAGVALAGAGASAAMTGLATTAVATGAGVVASGRRMAFSCCVKSRAALEAAWKL